jgi:DNA-binding protein H-NS
MSQWEYRKIDLNQLPRKTDDIGLLCDAGEEEWELVAILANNVAYLKRQLEDPGTAPTAASRDATSSTREASARSNDARGGKTQELKVKYRDPETNETWSGRGRMASWLKRKQDAGENIDKYLV